MTLAHTPPMLHSPLADLDRHTFNPRLFCFDFQAGSTCSHSAGVIGLDLDRLISKPSIYSFRGPQSPSKAMLITSIWNDLDFFATGGDSTVLLFDLFLSCKSSRHLIKTPHQDTSSRHPIKTPHQDTPSRHLIKTPRQDTPSRNSIKTPHQDTSSRHSIKTPRQDTPSRHPVKIPSASELRVYRIHQQIP